MDNLATGNRFPEFELFDGLEEAVVAADARGRLVYANEPAATLLGWEAADLLGRPLTVLVPDRLTPSHRRGFTRFSTGEELRFSGQPLRLNAECKDGSEVEVDVVLSVLERDGNRLAVATLRPAETHSFVEDPLALVEELHANLTNTPFGPAMNRLVATLGRRLGFDFAGLWVPDTRIDRLRSVAMWQTAANAFPEFTQRTHRVSFGRGEGLPGRAWESGVPVWSTDISAESGFLRGSAAARDGLHGGLVFPVLSDHDVVGVIELYSIRPRELDAAMQRALVRVGTELGPIIARRLIDESAAFERARLELALEAGELGVWHWDIGTNIVTWSESVQGMLGRSGGFIGTAEDFSAVLHPADRDRVLVRFQRAVEPGGERELEIDYRVVRDDGEVRWHETRGRALVDDEGEVFAITGVVTDVTDRKESELALSAEHARLDLALEAGGMGVWDWDLARDEVRMSVPLQIEFGLPPRGGGEDLMSRIHPDDRERVSTTVADALAGDGRYAMEVRILRPDGSVAWVSARGAATRDAEGEIVSLIGVASDITDRVTTEERLRRKSELLQSLNDVGRAITSNLELDNVVQLVTDVATRLTGAEFGAFFYNVIDPRGERYMLYSISGVPREAFSRFPMPRNTDLFHPTFAGEEVVRLADVTRDDRYGKTAPHFGMPAGHLPVRSYLAVPVVAGDGEVFGGLFFGHSERGVFSEHDEALAVGIAAQASVAIANARLYQSTVEEVRARQRAFEERDNVARVLQRSLLPPELPVARKLEFGARYVSGSEMVGGDFYDVFPIGQREWGLVMGDVCGKGAEAAAVTALARYTIRSTAVITPEPREVLLFLNDALNRDEGTDRFCTGVFGLLVTGETGHITLRIAHGGHPPALILRASGPVEAINETGTVLGVMDEPPIAQQTLVLERGDTVILYTDGVTETQGEGGRFGIERLMELAAPLAGRSAQQIADAITEAVAEHSTTRTRDDIAILAARVTG